MKIIIPPKYHDKLGNKIIATRGVGGCVFLISEKYWEVSIHNIESMKFNNPNTQKFALFLINSGVVKIDRGNDGEITIPKHLKDYAGIKKIKDIIFLENKEVVEVWNQIRLRKYRAKLLKEKKEAKQIKMFS
ncbi:MAG: hypothetical protein WC705_00065 [Candidatus Paceibacterota bacterium]|jgi:MraZ protein